MQRITAIFTILLFIWFATEAFAQIIKAGEPTEPKAKSTIAVADLAADAGQEKSYHVKSTLYALDANSGKTLWTFQTDRGIQHGKSPQELVWQYRDTAIAVGDSVYWGIEDQLIALEKTTDTVKWRFDNPEKTAKLFSEEPSLVVANGAVCIGANEQIYGVDERTGKLKWKQAIPGMLPYVPISGYGERVYALAEEGRPATGAYSPEEVVTGYLYAIQAETGEVDWLLKIRGDFAGSHFVLDGDTIYLRTSQALYALSATLTPGPSPSSRGEPGEVRWQFPQSYSGPGPYRQDIIVGDKTVYLLGDTLYALDKATGEVEWGCDGFYTAWKMTGAGSGIDGYQFQHADVYSLEVDGFLYIQNGPQPLYAFDLAQIEQLRALGKRWWTELGEHREVPPPERMTKRPTSPSSQ